MNPHKGHCFCILKRMLHPSFFLSPDVGLSYRWKLQLWWSSHCLLRCFLFYSNWKNRKMLALELMRWVSLCCKWSLTSRSVQWDWLHTPGGRGYLTEGLRPSRAEQPLSVGTWYICGHSKNTTVVLNGCPTILCMHFLGPPRQPSGVGMVGSASLTLNGWGGWITESLQDLAKEHRKLPSELELEAMTAMPKTKCARVFLPMPPCPVALSFHRFPFYSWIREEFCVWCILCCDTCENEPWAEAGVLCCGMSFVPAWPAVPPQHS